MLVPLNRAEEEESTVAVKETAMASVDSTLGTELPLWKLQLTQQQLGGPHTEYIWARRRRRRDGVELIKSL